MLHRTDSRGGLCRNGGKNRVQTAGAVQQSGGGGGPPAPQSGPPVATGAPPANGPLSMPGTRSRSTRVAGGVGQQQPRTSASNMQGGLPDGAGAGLPPDGTGGASPHNMSPTLPMQGGGLAQGPMGLGVMDLSSPNAPLSPHSPDTPHSVSEIINGRDREFHDFMSFLGGEADDADLGMEFNLT